MRKSLAITIIAMLAFCTGCGNLDLSQLNSLEIPEVVKPEIPDIDLSGINEGIEEFQNDYIVDELFTTNVNDVSFTLFRVSDTYFLSRDEAPGWVRVEGEVPEEAELSDFGFARVNADLVIYNGGVAGFNNAPHIKDINSFEKISYTDAEKEGLFADYDTNDMYFSGIRVFKYGERKFYLVYSAPKTYYLYEEGKPLGTFGTSYEAEIAMGLRTEVPYGTVFDSIGSLPIYAFRCGERYLVYSRYDGVSEWMPLLNADRENAPTGFELEDGEAIYINGASIVQMTCDGRSELIVISTEDAHEKEKIGISTLTLKVSPAHWEEGTLEGDTVMYQYSAGGTMILYIDGKYHVYSDNSDTVYIGTYDTVEEVNEILGK